MLRFSLALFLVATPALSEVPRVIADTQVTQSLVAQVMGDLGAPEVLLEPGADPHSMQFRPSQARALAGADLVVWTGPGLTPWLEGPVESLAAGQVLRLSAIEGLHRRAYDEPGHDEEDHDEEEHDEEEDDDGEHDDGEQSEEDDDDHAHGDVDPHLWLDPQNVAIWLRALAATLSARDPANATAYAANAETAVNATLALQAELAVTLAPAQDVGLVMFHDAYGYFAEAFGLSILATITDGDASSPGAARIAALRAELAAAGALCLFPEVNHPEDFALVVAEGSALRVGAPLDPAGVTLQPGAELYGALMRGLAQAIADCVNG